MSDKKYLVCPGEVTSRTDGDTHYIGAARLMDLYRVNPSECMVLRGPYIRILHDGLIKLHPRWSGDYSLPEGGGK